MSSLDPRDLTDDLIAMVGDEPKLCDHLHVSLQSLSTNVLRGMGRSSTNVDELVKKLSSFRKKYPCAGLGADFIVGFPGETEDDFNETLRRVEKIGFSYAHIFRYSVRPGTEAASLTSQVCDSVKSSRSTQLRKVINKSRSSFLLSSSTDSSRIVVESHFLSGV